MAQEVLHYCVARIDLPRNAIGIHPKDTHPHQVHNYGRRVSRLNHNEKGLDPDWVLYPRDAHAYQIHNNGSRIAGLDNDEKGLDTDRILYSGDTHPHQIHNNGSRLACLNNNENTPNTNSIHDPKDLHHQSRSLAREGITNGLHHNENFHYESLARQGLAIAILESFYDQGIAGEGNAAELYARIDDAPAARKAADANECYVFLSLI